jgi:pyrimidine operon attenuation protein/uracil phosphoribosyltransferase
MDAEQIMTADEIRKALDAIAEAILERQGGAADLMLVGIGLDVSPYRDDRGGAIDADAAAVIPGARLRPYDPARTTIVLVDDVLFTGRTVRAALEALMDQGRPAAVRLAVLIDRGHRELPIDADFVGRSVRTAPDERVEVRLGDDEPGPEGVYLARA